MKAIVSIVCPFYNEAAILEGSVRLMMRNLHTLEGPWELVIVNDGSSDESLSIARRMESEFPGLKVVSYAPNRGRGYAIRRGAWAAAGDILVTTEIDCSWGDDVVHRLVAELRHRPDADVIVASPHLPGGGYRNVPWHRVLLSTLGNLVIRAGMSQRVTMNTGMTRLYRRARFLALPLDEDEKEMHLEVINKANAFGYRIYEIPATLEWKTDKLMKRPGARRRSSSGVNKLIRTHVLFSLVAAPFRYIFVASALLTLGALFFMSWAVLNLFSTEPSIFLALTAFFLGLFAFLVFTMGLLAHQGLIVQRDVWRLRSEVRGLREEGTMSPPEG